MEQGEKVNHSDLFYLLQNKQYGLPADSDISRNEAYAIACEALESLDGLPTDFMMYYRETHEAYRIDNPQQPLYWFSFIRIWRDSAMNKTALELKLPATITVLIDPHNGDIIDIKASGVHYERFTDRFGM